MKYHEGTAGNNVSCIQNGSDCVSKDAPSDAKKSKTFQPVFRRNGERIPGVYVKNGHYYARIKDPVTERYRWARARSEDTAAGAEELVKDLRKARSVRQAEIYHNALNESSKCRLFSSLRQCLALYPDAAAEHRPGAGGSPNQATVNTTSSAMRRNFAQWMDESVDRANEVLEKFVAASGEMNQYSRRTAAACLRCVLAPWALRHYRKAGLRVPDAIAWTAQVYAEPFHYKLPPKDLRDRTSAAGRDELARGTDIGLVYMLCYFCAMSARDAALARWDWLRDDGSVLYRRHKTNCRANPPLPPDIEQRWRGLAGDTLDPWNNGGFVLPQMSESVRRHYVNENFAAWMRSLGWDSKTYHKAAHELRKLAASQWMSKAGPQWCSAWTGDTITTLQAHYADFVPEMRPPAVNLS